MYSTWNHLIGVIDEGALGIFLSATHGIKSMQFSDILKLVISNLRQSSSTVDIDLLRYCGPLLSFNTQKKLKTLCHCTAAARHIYVHQVLPPSRQ